MTLQPAIVSHSSVKESLVELTNSYASADPGEIVSDFSSMHLDAWS